MTKRIKYITLSIAGGINIYPPTMLYTCYKVLYSCYTKAKSVFFKGLNKMLSEAKSRVLYKCYTIANLTLFKARLVNAHNSEYSSQNNDCTEN